MTLVRSLIPWFLPGTALALLLGIAARRRLASYLQITPFHAVALVVSLGVILAATLTPLYGTINLDNPVIRGCDLSRLGFAPLGLLIRVNDTSLNVLICVPLGLSIALIPRSRRRTALILGAIALPFVIEGTQLLVPGLGRGCQSADVVDNLTGIAAGGAAGWLVTRRRRG